MNIRRTLSKNWFLIGLLLAVITSLTAPELGVSINYKGLSSTILVVLLFFVSGLSLPTESIRSGLSNVKLHLFLQLFIFAVIPLYFLGTTVLLKKNLDPLLLTGILALSVLPTTVSSCIVFTQSAGGNVVATMFNASLANVVGVILSPLLLSLLLQQTGQTMESGELIRILLSLVLKMLLPIFIGQFVRIQIRERIQPFKKAMGTFGNIVILIIIWFSFSQPALDPSFISFLAKLWPLFIYLLLSHFVLLGLTLAGTRLLKLNKANTYTSLFVAPQKTLAMGAPLLTTYFTNDPSLIGIALLPLIFYHFCQLLIAGLIPRFINRLNEK